MGNLMISEKKLLKEYNKRIDEICDYIETKSSFTGEEVCSIVIGILESEKIESNLSPEGLYEIYAKKINNMGISREEWVKNYGIPQIIGIIYEILEKNT